MRSIEERRSTLRERFETWTVRTLDEWLDVCAQRYPDRPLVITDRLSYTYADVAAESQRLADGLIALGVRPGDRVGMLMANYAEFVPLKFAIARTGAVAIPFNYLYKRDELDYVLAQSRCSVLITMTSFAGLDYQEMLDGIVPGWDTADFDSQTDLRKVVLLHNAPGGREGVLSYEGLAHLGDEQAGAHANVPHRGDDVGDMLYTSGSTGSPKGVLVTHDAVLRTGYASALTRGYDDGRRILFSLPCYHMFGYVEGLLSATFVGGAVIMQESFSPEGYFHGIQNHRADDVLCVPTMAIAMIESPAREQYDFSTLQAVLCGSAPAPVWLWEKFRTYFGATEIITGYGMTECGGAMTLSRPEDGLVLASTTVGRTKLAGAAGFVDSDLLCEYRTADPVTGEIRPEGETGEVISRGATMMRGYYDKPEETAQTLRGEWVYSGDLGRIRPDGYLELTGRSKELYKSGGELVMPKEVEDVLQAHQLISQVFAIGVVDERWGEIGCVVVVALPEALITESEVIDYCKARLAKFKVPKRVVFLEADQLPKTPTGKVQKFKLVELVSAKAEGVA